MRENASASRRARRGRRQAGQWGMMDQHDADDALFARGVSALRAKPASWWLADLPAATNGGVWTAELSPISATPPRRRTYGNPSRRLALNSAPQASTACSRAQRSTPEAP